jgi:hypothetical protein
MLKIKKSPSGDLGANVKGKRLTIKEKDLIVYDPPLLPLSLSPTHLFLC